MFQKVPYDLSGLVGSSSRKFWVLQREYNWQVIMPHDIGGWVGVIVSQFCQSIRFGDYSMEKINEMRYGADKRYYAGLRTVNTVTLSFLVSADSSVVNYFDEWHKLIVDDSGYYHPKVDYARDIYAIMYDRSGIETYMYRLKGCFPKNKPQFNLAYSKADVLTIEMELSVDKVALSTIAGSVINKVASNIIGRFK